MDAKFEEWWNTVYLNSFNNMPKAIMLSFKEVAEKAWYEAKRELPVVNLPCPLWVEASNGENIDYFSISEVKSSLDIAGIKYKVEDDVYGC